MDTGISLPRYWSRSLWREAQFRPNVCGGWRNEVPDEPLNLAAVQEAGSVREQVDDDGGDRYHSVLGECRTTGLDSF